MFYGIWSTISKRWCFGIVGDSMGNAFNQLRLRIGDEEAQRPRFEARKMTESEADAIHAETIRRKGKSPDDGDELI